MRDNRSVQREIFDELDRAREKFPGEEELLTDADWLQIVVEEVGEAAHELNEATGRGEHVDRRRLAEEVAQIAAMGARWLSTLPEPE